MSRNLCTSSCCGNVVRLSDLRGKPIEFRRYFDEPPDIGTKWICPTCGVEYFAFWRNADWDHMSSSWSRGFVIDLSYYDSYNDETLGSLAENEKPAYLCEDNAEDIQTEW